MFIKLSYPKQESRNVLLGLILVFAILDHTRMFFYYWNVNPVDISNTSIAVFLTRFLSHFFAPAVFFLVGIEVFLYAKQFGRAKLNFTLLRTAGILLLIELFINNFLYTFDVHYRTIGLFILGLLGLCLLCMIGLQYLGRKVLLGLGIVLILGHNLLDRIQFDDHSFLSICWYILHQQKFILIDEHLFIVNYTLVPWLAVLLLGYYFGKYYQSDYDVLKRKKILVTTGWLCLGLFLLLRVFNQYGDPFMWHNYADPSKTAMSFLNLTKYPASLDFLAMTLSIIFLFFGYTTEIKSRYYTFFSIIAQRPLFIYLFSTFLIHLLAVIFLWIAGDDPKAMIITSASYSKGSSLSLYGYSIEVVYGIWIGLLLVLYYIASRNYLAK
ncbi:MULTISPECIES: hypothetical protein [unclassified Sphingobacterium]|uniref:hypothetical protein n=1 Tax=unclassified Sphingobacterium TaxID=2609468 RepID=UPI0010434012|nr:MULTISPECIES: hypothetical protein [unclassified Sphingobacterium]MCS3556575.1 putative membrane protein [Sphingobacterium sp. JUb21]TCQ99869.1 putative membrane protein [Sphingobacterium sp. JUb20]